MSDPFDAPDYVQPLVRRTKDGRPYVFDFDKGKETPWTRVTSFIDCLEDKSALAKWGTRMALTGIRDTPALGRRLMEIEAVPDLPPEPTREEVMDHNGRSAEEKALLNALIEEAKDAAGWKRKAELGTRLHELSEIADMGKSLPVGVAPALDADIAAYREAIARFGLVPLEREVFVVNDEVKAAGTFDRLYEWHRGDGRVLRVIGDLKTGRVDYGQGKLAMQIALYANSKRYNPDFPEERESLGVDTTVGLIVHLPVGKAECRIYKADLRAGWRGVLLAQQVREWRRESRRGMLSDLALDGDFSIEQAAAALDR